MPPRRDLRAIVLKKSRALLKDLTPADARHLAQAAERARLLTKAADDTPELAEASVDLVVTSPPFLTVVNYKMDNWLRCWFCGIDRGGRPHHEPAARRPLAGRDGGGLR